MLFRALVLIGLLGGNVAAEKHLRASDSEAKELTQQAEANVDHLDLEVVLENGERELFPLLPGTKCPPGHTCRSRTVSTTGLNPLSSAMKKGMAPRLAAGLNWQELDKDLNTVVRSDDYCTRRAAMARAAGLAAGVALGTVNAPAYAAETKNVKMGNDAGGLKFEPEKISICKGDSVKWTNNKGGPHNVVFDEDNIPAGVDQEKISMSDQLGEEGATFTMSFDTSGTYGYYCEPHRGAGMQATLIVA